MRWPRLHAPRIHTEEARHSWTLFDRPDPYNPWRVERVAHCPTCEHTVTVVWRDEKFLNLHANGCAGRRFRGRYRPGDHVDTGNMRYVVVRPGRQILLRDLGRPQDCLSCPRKEVTPVLAGRAQALKRLGVEANR